MQTHSDVVLVVEVVIVAGEVSTAVEVEGVDDVVADKVVGTIRL